MRQWCLSVCGNPIEVEMQKRWNVMIVPSEPGRKIYNFHVSLRPLWIAVAVVLSLVVFTVAGTLYTGHARKKESANRISQLQTELEARDAELAALDKEISILEELEDKLRTIAGLKPRDRSDLSASGGKGGPAPGFSDDELMAQYLPDVSDKPAGERSVQELLDGSVGLKAGFAEILEVLVSESTRLSCVPSINPVDSQDAWISSGFGYRSDPFTGKRRFHDGCDIVAPRGTSILAPADGIVTFGGWRDGLGRTVEIEHGDGYITMYGHSQKLFVKKGDLVKRGDLIAQIGSSGRSTGPHLHYEIQHNGKLINPYKYLVR